MNATYKLDDKLQNRNDPFKSSNEIKRTFYVSESESRQAHLQQHKSGEPYPGSGLKHLDLSEKLL